MQSLIQVDLDGVWTYRRYFGAAPEPEALDAVYTQALPRFLALFDRYKVKATFFVVAKDLEVPEHKHILRQAVDAGHEIANHSYSHPLDFSAMGISEIEREIDRAQAVFSGMGCACRGFRAPAFGIREDICAVLEKRGFSYDASLMPSYLQPVLLKLAHTWIRRRAVNASFGRFIWGRAPRDLYHPHPERIWKPGAMRLWEVPLGVSPWLSLPVHTSYLRMWGTAVLSRTLDFYERGGIPFSFLFHGIDCLDMLSLGLNLPGARGWEQNHLLCAEILKLITTRGTTSTIMELISRKEGKRA